MFAHRSVIELIVLVFTLVAGLLLLGLGTTVAVVEIRDPAADTGVAVQALASAISAIIGALLGLLAGKSEALNGSTGRHREPEPE
jgi:hypothetical protein